MKHWTTGFALLLLLVGRAAYPASLALSDAPLSVSTSVDPNVMFLVDTSGSMNNIIWAGGYDNTTTYADWGNGVTVCGGGCYTAGSWSSSDGNVHYDDLSQGSCSSGYLQGKNGSGTTKCLKLPDPVGSGNTRYSGNYLNYLFSTYADGTDLTDGTIPDDYRMNVARTVTSDLVTTTSGMRFGIASFYGPSSHSYGHGATIDATCGSSQSTLTSAISGLSASTNTPLAEAYYEITRYFRGLSSYYHDSTSYTSPIQYRCQKNFVVVVTDGLPTYDTTFPSDDPADVTDTSHSLPNWDGVATATTQADYPNFPQYSDGFKPSGSEGDEGYSLYLDDLAKFGNDIDLMTSGTDDAGGSYQDSAYSQQNLITYTVGFSTSNQMLEDAASYGQGEYFTATNSSELSTALQDTLSNIETQTTTSSAATLSTGYISSGVRLYQGRFDSADWSGQLLSFPIDTDTSSSTYGQLITTGSGPEGAEWDAGDKIPAAGSRTILTYKPSSGAGIAFRWPSDPSNPSASELDSSQTTSLGSSAVLDYLRGDQSGEVQNGGAYRNRSTLLGDIVNSSSVYVGPPDRLFPDNWGSGAPENDHPYSDFLNDSTNSTRDDMIYVGANDGMLHGFDASTGVEKLAYIPSSVYNNLSLLSGSGYTHHYYVDGSPAERDAYFNSAWHTVLVGGLNGGGQGIYALDITNPSNFSESSPGSTVLWEFTDADDSDLGYTFSQPDVVRMHNGKWAVIFGNGYNNTEADGHASSTGHAVLYIAFIGDGTDGSWGSSDFVKIDTKSGSATTPNGLATVSAVDTDGDYIVDAIYAGDLQGNLWKFDVSSSNSNSWKVAYGNSATPAPLFTACAGSTCTSSNRQPITTKPVIGTQAKGNGVMVYFGTGKYLESSDNIVTGATTQSFYGIQDNGETVSGRSALLEQQILWQGTSGSDELRVTSANTIDWTTDHGWYIDLLPPDGDNRGERQVTKAVLRSGRIIFTTLIPTDDPCAPGGDSWIMELNAADGTRLDYSPYDLNNDGVFDTSDYVTETFDDNGDGTSDSHTTPTSGRKLKVGGAASPTIGVPGDGNGDSERKYISGNASSGVDVQTFSENAGTAKTGRQSWQQIK